MSPDSSDQSNTEEEVAVKKPAKGVYLLPNSFTTASLFSGFYAVVSGMSGNFENAAIAIFISMCSIPWMVGLLGSPIQQVSLVQNMTA